MITATLATAPASDAGDRVHVVRWLPSPDAPVDRYHVYVGGISGTYTERIEIDSFQIDQGVASFDLRLDADRGHYISMTALRDGTESPFSNELYVGPLHCPDPEGGCLALSFEP